MEVIEGAIEGAIEDAVEDRVKEKVSHRIGKVSASLFGLTLFGISMGLEVYTIIISSPCQIYGLGVYPLLDLYTMNLTVSCTRSFQCMNLTTLYNGYNNIVGEEQSTTNFTANVTFSQEFTNYTYDSSAWGQKVSYIGEISYSSSCAPENLCSLIQMNTSAQGVIPLSEVVSDLRYLIPNPCVALNVWGLGEYQEISLNNSIDVQPIETDMASSVLMVNSTAIDTCSPGPYYQLQTNVESAYLAFGQIFLTGCVVAKFIDFIVQARNNEGSSLLPIGDKITTKPRYERANIFLQVLAGACAIAVYILYIVSSQYPITTSLLNTFIANIAVEVVTFIWVLGLRSWFFAHYQMVLDKVRYLLPSSAFKKVEDKDAAVAVAP